MEAVLLGNEVLAIRVNTWLFGNKHVYWIFKDLENANKLKEALEILEYYSLKDISIEELEKGKYRLSNEVIEDFLKRFFYIAEILFYNETMDRFARIVIEAMIKYKKGLLIKKLENQVKEFLRLLKYKIPEKYEEVEKEIKNYYKILIEKSIINEENVMFYDILKEFSKYLFRIALKYNVVPHGLVIGRIMNIYKLKKTIEEEGVVFSVRFNKYPFLLEQDVNEAIYVSYKLVYERGYSEELIKTVSEILKLLMKYRENLDKVIKIIKKYEHIVEAYLRKRENLEIKINDKIVKIYNIDSLMVNLKGFLSDEEVKMLEKEIERLGLLLI